jgi:hypothetical protein
VLSGKLCAEAVSRQASALAQPVAV